MLSLFQYMMVQSPKGILCFHVECESLYINALNKESMTDNVPKPAPLRIVAGVILGIFAGFFIFFAISLLVGMINDILGTSEKTFRHARRYMEYHSQALKAFKDYAADVDKKTFPCREHSARMDAEELEKLKGMLG